LLMIF